MEGSQLVAKAMMIQLPASLIDKVAIDRATGSVYVDRRFSGDPVLLSWQDRNRSNGIVMHIKPSDVDEVAKLRDSGMRTAVDSDMIC